jgi:hypothetical protein
MKREINMELIGSLFVFLTLVIVSYSYAKKKRLEQETIKKTNVGSKNQLNILQEELERRTKIINRVEAFIKSSKFIEPIATWRNERIYKYVFNNGYLYEFEDILPENNQRIGIDDDFLCFKQFCYKRVNNPTEFMTKFGAALNQI